MNRIFPPVPKKKIGQIKERTLHDSIVVLRGSYQEVAEILNFN